MIASPDHRILPAYAAFSILEIHPLLPAMKLPDATSGDHSPEAEAPGPLEGRIQTVAPKLIAGWAVDLDHPDRPVELEVWVQDRPMAPKAGLSASSSACRCGRSRPTCCQP
jgi:hypothetical protein